MISVIKLVARSDDPKEVSTPAIQEVASGELPRLGNYQGFLLPESLNNWINHSSGARSFVDLPSITGESYPSRCKTFRFSSAKSVYVHNRLKTISRESYSCKADFNAYNMELNPTAEPYCDEKFIAAVQAAVDQLSDEQRTTLRGLYDRTEAIRALGDVRGDSQGQEYSRCAAQCSNFFSS